MNRLPADGLWPRWKTVGDLHLRPDHLFDPVTVTPSPLVDRFVRDIAHEWRMRAANKAYAIDAGPRRKR